MAEPVGERQRATGRPVLGLTEPSSQSVRRCAAEALIQAYSTACRQGLACSQSKSSGSGSMACPPWRSSWQTSARRHHSGDSG